MHFEAEFGEEGFHFRIRCARKKFFQEVSDVTSCQRHVTRSERLHDYSFFCRILLTIFPYLTHTILFFSTLCFVRIPAPTAYIWYNTLGITLLMCGDKNRFFAKHLGSLHRMKQLKDFRVHLKKGQKKSNNFIAKI